MELKEAHASESPERGAAAHSHGEGGHGAGHGAGHHGGHHGPDPIFIQSTSKLCGRCGPRDRHCRLELFEFVEARWFQYIMLALLVVDVLVVGLEICVTYRLIKPAPDLDQQSLGIPRDMVCAGIEVEYRYGYPIKESDPGTLEDCCHDFAREYPVTDMWDTGVFGDDPGGVNVAACMLHTNWTGADGPRRASRQSCSTAGQGCCTQHHRPAVPTECSRGLVAGLVVGSLGPRSSAPRCYESRPKYCPPLGHYPIQDIMHWVSNAILFVFLLELLLPRDGPAQFFCACPTVREDDLVRVVDRDTGNVRCKHAIVTHVNLHRQGVRASRACDDIT